MASQNAEIAEALAFFRAKKRAYASPMEVAHALRERSTGIRLVDVRNPVGPIPTTIKGAVWIPEREIARRLDELPVTGLSSWSVGTCGAVSRRQRPYRFWKTGLSPKSSTAA